MNTKISLYKFLKDYPKLQQQYVFYNCFIISSKEIMSQYKEAGIKGTNYIKDIEVYFTPNYLYNNDPSNSIFKMINHQKEKKYYFLKEHIFYYQFLLKCLDDKKNKNKIDTLQINEIFYRTLLNRLYKLQSNPDSNLNYGIGEIFNLICIYSIIESNIINQIMNMKKFSFELLSMKENEVLQLFGVNDEIDNQSFLYNKLLNSISASNSSTDENILEINPEIYKIEKIEKYLLDVSSELFLFNYITKQFKKSELVQIPKLIFFPSIYNNKFENIYEIINKGENLKKCQLLDFCGVLEIDGAFKYIGEQRELNSESLIIILSEYLNSQNKIKEYIEYISKITIIYKWNKYKNSTPENLENQFKKYNLLKKEEFNKENLRKIIEKYEEDIKVNKVSLNKELIIKKNDILLIENKREFPGNLSKEINSFIDHSFFFINLYKYLNILENSSEIHLIFIYNHNRNHSDEQKSYNDINNFLDNNQIKLSNFSNKIKFYVVHSLPNLSVSILDRLDNKIQNLENTISEIRKENKDLKNLLDKQNLITNNLIAELNKLKDDFEKMKSKNNQ